MMYAVSVEKDLFLCNLILDRFSHIRNFLMNNYFMFYIIRSLVSKGILHFIFEALVI